MRLLFCFIFFLTGIPLSIAQKITNERSKLNGQTILYSVMLPKDSIKGLFLLLPSLNEKPASVFENTGLPSLLAEKGYVILVPRLGTALYADDWANKRLDYLVTLVREKYNISDSRIVIGGFSSGGAISLGYAEYLIETHSRIQPFAVFGIDPALDLERLHASAVHMINYNCEEIRKEGSFIKGFLERWLPGTPATHPEQYLRFSVFSARADSGGRARFLKDIPLRLYSEPDLEFVRNKYCKELQFSEINAFDVEKAHALLVSLGNKRCEYIKTAGRGFHSWNIMDAQDCMNWIMELN